MRAVRRLVSYRLAAGWPGLVALALLVGLAGGAVLTAVAGARRTASAYPRFLVASRASDVLAGPAGTGVRGYDDALAGLPGVAAIAPMVGLNAQPVGPDGKLDEQAVVSAPLDGRFGHLLEIPKLLAGRQPQPDRPREVMVDQIAARDLHLQVGSRLTLGAVAGSDLRHIRWLSERVVGIMVDRGSVVPVTTLDQVPVIRASTALFRELGPRYEAFDGAYVKLRSGATPGSFGHEAQALTRRFSHYRGPGVRGRRGRAGHHHRAGDPPPGGVAGPVRADSRGGRPADHRPGGRAAAAGVIAGQCHPHRARNDPRPADRRRPGGGGPGGRRGSGHGLRCRGRGVAADADRAGQARRTASWPEC